MRRRLPPLNALRAFEAAARHESFSRAAEELHVTHAAVSHQVKTLETWLRIPLFERLSRSVRLTPGGHTYLVAIEAAFDRIDAATTGLVAPDAEQPLHVTTTAAFAVRWLAPRLGRLWRAHPGLDLRLHEVPWLTHVDFNRTQVDVAVQVGPESAPGVQVIPLMAGTLAPMCSPMLLRDGPPLATPEDLLQYKLLHSHNYDPWRGWFQRAGMQAGELAQGSVFDDTNLIYSAALSGQGIGLLHTALTVEETRAGQLVQPFGAEPRDDLGYYVAYRASREHDPRVAGFRDWLVAMAGPEADPTQPAPSAPSG
jgi:LysR family glycine cleavage system transcriptional activator